MENHVDIRQDIETILNDMAKDVDELIDPSNVVGTPITVGDTTIIPLLSAGFGFGVGGGGGEGRSEKGPGGEGLGEGVGGGGNVKPVAVVVVNPQGVQVTPVPGSPSGIEKLGAAIGDALSSRTGGKKSASEAAD